MNEDEIKALMNQGLTALYNVVNDQMAVLRNGAGITRMIANRLISLHPNRAQLLAELQMDCEHSIADTLTRGYPEAIVHRHQQEVEALQAYLNALAQEQNLDTASGS